MQEENKLNSRLFQGFTYLHKMKHQIILAVSGHQVSAMKTPNIIVENFYLEDLATLKLISKAIYKKK